MLLFLLMLFIYLDLDRLRDAVVGIMFFIILIDLFMGGKPPKDSKPLYTDETILGI